LRFGARQGITIDSFCATDCVLLSDRQINVGN
jgi:hypothetical protein